VHGACKSRFHESVDGGESKTVQITACYVTSSMKLPQKPGGNAKWFRNIESEVPKPVSTIHEPKPKRSASAGRLAPTERNALGANWKRRKHADESNDDPEEADEATRDAMSTSDAMAAPDATATPDAMAQATLDQPWWETGDA
jgi:hypothetical protein